MDITRTFKISLDVRGFFYAALATCATQFILKTRLKMIFTYNLRIIGAARRCSHDH